MIDGFLLGVIFTCSIVAGLFFLRFWKLSNDSFFLAFALSFFMEGLNRATLLLSDSPSVATHWTYIVRLLSFLLILAAVLRKNYGKGA